MKFGRTSNPFITDSRLRGFERADVSEGTMTSEGSLTKTGILLLLVFASASWVWKNAFAGANVMPYVIGGGIVGFIIAMITMFKPQYVMYTAPVYAVLEGFVVGGASAMYASLFDGVVIKAALLTIGILFAMLFVYRTGLIKVTDKFKSFLAISMGGIFIFYILTWILSFFGVHSLGIFNGGIIGIGLSLFIVVIASLTLLWDFDTIDRMANSGAPKYMEWYGGFTLLITIVWLYLEILRLVSMLSRN
jgi:uncharacterized YccA/Bax inhibitor family protein